MFVFFLIFLEFRRVIYFMDVVFLIDILDKVSCINFEREKYFIKIFVWSVVFFVNLICVSVIFYGNELDFVVDFFD